LDADEHIEGREYVVGKFEDIVVGFSFFSSGENEADIIDKFHLGGVFFGGKFG